MRTVEVRFDLGPGRPARLRSSAGYLVNRSTVLTCAHSLDYQTELQFGQSLAVRLVGTVDEIPASPFFVGSEQVDLAVLTIDETLLDELLPLCDQVSFARLNRDSPLPVERCWAIGFPTFKRVGGFPNTVHVLGRIPPGDNLDTGTLALDVLTKTPHGAGPRPAGAVGHPAAHQVAPEPGVRRAESVWSGMSGAVVFASDGGAHRVVGVVMEHLPPEGVKTLTVAPITLLDTLDDVEGVRCWDQLCKGGSRDISWIPPKRSPGEVPLRTYQSARPARRQLGSLRARVSTLLETCPAASLRFLAEEFGVVVDERDGRTRAVTPADFGDAGRRSTIAMLSADRIYADDLALERIADAFFEAVDIGPERVDVADLVLPFKGTVPLGAFTSLAAFYADFPALAGPGPAPAVTIRAREPWYAYWHLVRARAKPVPPRVVDFFPTDYPDPDGAGVGKRCGPGEQIWDQVMDLVGELDHREPDISQKIEDDLRRALRAALYEDGDDSPIAVLWPRLRDARRGRPPNGVAIAGEAGAGAGAPDAVAPDGGVPAGGWAEADAELATLRELYAQLLFFVILDPDGERIDGIGQLEAFDGTPQHTYEKLYRRMAGSPPRIAGSLRRARRGMGRVRH
ncbi:hypothetical protein CC117_20890 [Parafrankia colletiae]|uniref:Trypsin-like peptidase domain-containing protein n=1 Tax=Parafrankia colletiae TaxID=573497 RepID=A0A1S1QM53_9ACTN|nr:trypsin-like peptidase domain-containing protein [Parafrankia colletiae]MCK9900610.1 trypsin-like peptidase domain-containing protein [Frankia sp. Cpl3]OHV34666.1 hypothetical protein CC117_20890 [Parafrankia colletiae]